MLFPRTAGAVIALSLIACGGETSPPSTPQNPTPSQRQPVLFTVGRGVTDTIDATVNSPVTVNVVGASGAARAGVLIVVDAQIPAGGPPVLPGTVLGSAPSVRTDANGNASIALKLGGLAGHWLLRARDAETGDSDTLSFTVKAGQATRVAFAPRDTAMYVAGSARVLGLATDRRGNAAVGTVSLSVDSGASVASVDADGRITGSSFGRTRIVGQLAGTSSRDTARVSVVPKGVLGVAASGLAPTSGIAMVNLDGSGFRLLAPGSASYAFPSWSPDGAAIVYNVGLPLGLLYRVDTNGVTSKLSALGAFASETWARYSYDGQFIYYTGGLYPDSLDTYRMRADGTGPRVRVTPLRPGSTRYWKASPSPDGTRLAYSEAGFTLHVLTLTGGADRTIPNPSGYAESPRFSPDGQWIAFADEGPHDLKIVRSDGSGMRSVSPAGMFMDNWGHDWSPDGAWIVGRGVQTLWLIRVADGLAIPLPYSGSFYNPTWRPR